MKYYATFKSVNASCKHKVQMNPVYFSVNSLLNLIYIQKCIQIIILSIDFSQSEHTHVTSTHKSILFLKKKYITSIDDEFLLLFVSFTQCLARG